MNTALILLSLVIPPQPQQIVSAPKIDAPLTIIYEPTDQEIQEALAAPVKLADANMGRN